MNLWYYLTRVYRYVSITSLVSAVLLCVVLIQSLWISWWSGWYILVGWLLLQGFLIETILKYFHYSYETDILDVILALIIVLVISFASASMSLDLIVENAHSSVFMTKNILSSDICNQAISIAESHAAEHGWLTKRHKNYPTTDLAVYSIDKNISIVENGRLKQVDFSLWVNKTIEEKVFPRLVSYYSLSSIDLLSMQDIFIVKYDGVTPGAQRHLQMHMDSSLLSFNIALSEYQTNLINGGTATFQGGGTHFALSDDVIQIERGSMLVHPSRIYHEGVAVTGGVRYILVGFVTVNQWSWNAVWRRFGTFSKCLSVYHERSGSNSGSAAETEYERVSSVCQPWLYTYYYSMRTLVSDIVEKPNDTVDSVIMKGLLVLIVVGVLLLVGLCISLCYCSGEYHASTEDVEFDDSRYEVVLTQGSHGSSNSVDSCSKLSFYNAKVTSKVV